MHCKVYFFVQIITWKHNVHKIFNSPKSSTVVSDSFDCASSDFPISHFGHPPNMVTCVRPRPKLKAVTVCPQRGFASSGRVSWGEGRNWLDCHWSCDNVIVYVMLITHYTMNPRSHMCTQISNSGSSYNQHSCSHCKPAHNVEVEPVTHLHVHYHSPPSTFQTWHLGSTCHSGCCYSYLDPQWLALGGILPIVEAAGNTVHSHCWPRGSLRPLQFGPLLGQVTQYT